MSETRILDGAARQHGGANDYMGSVTKAAATGAAVGTAIFIPANHLLKKKVGWYRALPLPGRVFVGLMTIIPVGTVFAEKAGERYIAKTQWSGVGVTEMEREAQAARERWDKMSTGDKIKDWSTRHQYGLIGGSWVASLGIAFGMVARNKYQTFPQKIVQARMYAQFLTVGVVLASAVLAGVNARGVKPQRPVDHSWQQVLEDGGTLSKADRIVLHQASKIPAATAKV